MGSAIQGTDAERGALGAAPEHRRRGPLLLAGLAAAGCLLLGTILADRLNSTEPPLPAPTFAERVTPRRTEGRFDAVTTNLGWSSARPRCSVVAYDVYGNALGSVVFRIGVLDPGASRAWDGRVRVTGRVERMSIHCR